MIDTHAHIDFKEFNSDREAAIERFFSGGGTKFINVGCSLSSSLESFELSEKYKNIYASVGIHPHDANDISKFSLKKIEELATHYKIVAIGEIGLDFYRNLSSTENQISAFKMQLEIAENHKKPIIIHCRDAYNELIDILKGYKTSNWKGVIHCFAASWDLAKEFLDLGFYVGFTGIVTYYKNKSKCDEEPEIYKVIRNMPADRILIETDCPYIAPVPYRGKRNEPLFVKYIAEKIANVRNVSFEEIEKQTSENAEKLFGI